VFRKFVVLGCAALLLGTGVARAQTNYPPAATLEMKDAQGGTIDDGVCVGDAIQVHSTGWAALADVKAEYFSEAIQIGTFKANPQGELNFTFHVPDAEPVPGTHTFRLSGNGPDDKPRSIEGPIKCVKCNPTATTVVATTTTTPGTPGTTSTTSGTGTGTGTGSGSGTGTGSNVLGRALDSSSSSNSGSAFGKTGADILPILEVALALFAIGAALVLAVRRRRAADALPR
jgi:hypothetical protein